MYDLIVTTEIMELKYLDDICNSTDIIQIGTKYAELSTFNRMPKLKCQ